MNIKDYRKVLQSSFSFKNHYTKWKNVRKTDFNVGKTTIQLHLS